ncbi:MAG: hypothetical protein COB04_03770 [Gammaproteobacteria bacterium]|nr:MAG: hypothetical protein COB04_03770 [Gammaproteobacteria bacterium]
MTPRPLIQAVAARVVLCTLATLLWIKISVAASVVITEQQALNFGPIIAYITQDIVIPPTDSGAAVFDITGDAYAQISVDVTNNRVTMTTGTGNGNTKKIVVNQWSYGGNVDSSGLGSLDQFGALTNIRIGATAAVKSSNIPGSYSGSGTVRIIYQ